MTLQCDQCPAPAVAFLPGSEPVVCVGIMVARGEKRRAWCALHWKQRFLAEEVSA
jgi:hypothetical protein